MKGFVKLDVKDYNDIVLAIDKMKDEIHRLNVNKRALTAENSKLEERLEKLQKTHKDTLNFVEKIGMSKECELFIEATKDIDDYE